LLGVAGMYGGPAKALQRLFQLVALGNSEFHRIGFKWIKLIGAVAFGVFYAVNINPAALPEILGGHVPCGDAVGWHSLITIAQLCGRCAGRLYKLLCKPGFIQKVELSTLTACFHVCVVKPFLANHHGFAPILPNQYPIRKGVKNELVVRVKA